MIKIYIKLWGFWHVHHVDTRRGKAFFMARLALLALLPTALADLENALSQEVLGVVCCLDGKYTWNYHVLWFFGALNALNATIWCYVAPQIGAWLHKEECTDRATCSVELLQKRSNYTESSALNLRWLPNSDIWRLLFSPIYPCMNKTWLW